MPRPVLRPLLLMLGSLITGVIGSAVVAQPGDGAAPYRGSAFGDSRGPASSPQIYRLPDSEPPRRGARLGAPIFNGDPPAARAAMRFTPRRAPAASPRNPPVAAPPRSERKFFELAQMVARVGDQPIFYGELLAAVNQFLAPQMDKASDWEIEQAREKLVKQMLTVTIDNKLRYLDFLRGFPQPDQLPEIFKRIDQQFFEKQLPILIERNKAKNAADLDVMLRKYGSSLEMSRMRFREQVLAMQAMQQKIDKKPEVTHAEMLDYYHEHAEDYAIPAKARWEQLMVRFDKFPSEREAEIALSKMGNRVYLGGAPLYAVAKESSQGYNADKGGYNDWTNKGSHASEEIDRALFGLEIGRLSVIIKSKVGLHIIRVIERREATRVPFTEAQVEIKEKLREEKVKAAEKEYLAGLRDGIEVWTIYDEDQASSTASDRSSGSGGVFQPAATP